MTYIDTSSGPGAAGSRDWGRSKDEELAARGLARQSRKVYRGGEFVLRAMAAASRDQPEATIDILLEAVWQRLALDGWPDSVSSPGQPSIRVNLFYSAAGREAAALVGSTSLRSPEATARTVLLTVMQELNISAGPALEFVAKPAGLPVGVPAEPLSSPSSAGSGPEITAISMGSDGVPGPDIGPEEIKQDPIAASPASESTTASVVHLNMSSTPLSPVAQTMARVYASPPDAPDGVTEPGPPLVAVRFENHDSDTAGSSSGDPDKRSDEARGWRAKFGSLVSKIGADQGQQTPSRLKLPMAFATGAIVLSLAGVLGWTIISGPPVAGSELAATGEKVQEQAPAIEPPAAQAAPWDRPPAPTSDPLSAAVTTPSPNPASSDRLSGQQPKAVGAAAGPPLVIQEDELPAPAGPPDEQALGLGPQAADLLRAELAAARAEAEKLARDQAEIRALLSKQTEMLARLQARQPRTSGGTPSVSTSSAPPPVTARSETVGATVPDPPAIKFGPGGTSDLGRIATVADGRRWASVIPGERFADLARRAERSVEDLRTWNAELGHVTPEMRLESGSVWIDPPRLSR